MTIEEINWVEVESLIRTKQFKVKNFATQNGLKSEAVRTALVVKFGDQLLFRRGKAGGVFFKDMFGTPTDD